MKAGSRTISNRQVALTPACTFRSSVVFGDRRRFAGRPRLSVTARFLGNAVLPRPTARPMTVAVR